MMNSWVGRAVVVLGLCAGAALQGRAADAAQGGGLKLGEHVRLGGEVGVGFFDTGSKGAFPNNEFRIDEAKLFLDAKISDEVFFFTELDLTLRESSDDNARVGEIYVAVEGIEELWGGGDFKLALRVGRLDIPFGEEYLTRDAIDNPFINHTLADIWGVDEGVGLFGRMGRVDYALAVQNGSFLRTRDGDPDKSVTARVGVEPVAGLRVSASAMRTGRIDAQVDEMTEVWFGNAYIGGLGYTNATGFEVELAQVDVSYRWSGGYVAVAAGGIRYESDGDVTRNDSDAMFWSAEVVQDVAARFYVGLRVSAVSSDEGFPVPGNADQSDWSDHHKVEDIWRGSAVVGWRVAEKVVCKAEYSVERGERAHGAGDVEDVDMLAVVLAAGF